MAGDEIELQRRIIESDDLSKLNMLVITLADEMLNLEPVKRRKIGRRLLQVSHTYLKRILFLSYSYRLTNDEKYLRQAEKELLSASSFSDWNPSHFLDVAEMTTALAIGYDWLYNDLDKNSRQIV
ncbi:MAG: heparinase, partial [Ignavibacteria bacterium]|nr:heparinase [Ignavibacteria bacterium]